MQQLAPSPSQQISPNHGLVSLWEIMQEFNVVGWMGILEWLIEQAAYATNADGSIYGRKEPIAPNRMKSIKSGFDRVSAICADAGLSTAAEMARSMGDSTIYPGYTNKRHSDDLVVLKRTIIANMRSLRLLRISADFVRYADCRMLWGAAYDAFPSASRDMEDAGKCLAYGAGTATVFHLMRIMEAGLKKFGARLGIPYAPSWDSYLKQLDTKFSEDYRQKSAEWKKDEPFYRDVAGDLQLVKFVWRNPTMHIVRSYTQDEAREVFSAVMAFMNRLALKFSEPFADEPAP